MAGVGVPSNFSDSSVATGSFPSAPAAVAIVGSGTARKTPAPAAAAGKSPKDGGGEVEAKKEAAAAMIDPPEPFSSGKKR